MAEEEKQGGKNKIILVLLLVLILCVGGVGVWYFFLRADTTASKKEQEIKNTQKEEITLVTVPPFLVNLSDPLGRRFIKMSINVEVSTPEIAGKLEKNMFQIRDKIILLLSSKTYSDLSALDSKIYLKNEIVDRINQVIAPDVIRQVYFTDMIIQ